MKQSYFFVIFLIFVTMSLLTKNGNLWRGLTARKLIPKTSCCKAAVKKQRNKYLGTIVTRIKHFFWKI